MDATATERARGERALLALFALFVLAVTTADVFNVVHERRRSGVALPLWEPAVWEGTSGVVLILLAPLVLAAARRWPLDWPPRASRLAAHLPVLLAFSLVHVLAMGGLRAGIYHLVGARYDAFGPLADFAYELRKDALIYAGVVILHGVWLRARLAGRASAPAADDGGVIEVRDGARRLRLPVAEIAWIEAAGNYVQLHGAQGAVLHRASLAEMERRLPGFVRIHRSRLVRRASIRAVETGPSGDFTVRLADGQVLAGSRRYRAAAVATHA